MLRAEKQIAKDSDSKLALIMRLSYYFSGRRLARNAPANDRKTNMQKGNSG